MFHWWLFTPFLMFPITLEYGVPLTSDKHVAFRIGCLLVIFVTFLLSQHANSDMASIHFDTSQILIQFGIMTLITTSLLNTAITVYLMNSGKSYYVYVNDAFRLFSVYCMVSIFILMFEEWKSPKEEISIQLYFDKSPLPLAVLLLLWCYYIIGVVFANILKYRHSTNVDEKINGTYTLEDSERSWHSWSSAQFIQWVLSRNIISRSSVRQLLIHGIYGEILHRFSIDDMVKLNLSFGDAYKLHTQIQRLVRENDGGFTRREEIRRKLFEQNTNDDFSQNLHLVNNLYSDQNLPADQQEMSFQGKSMKDMHSEASKLMKAKYGLSTPFISQNEDNGVVDCKNMKFTNNNNKQNASSSSMNPDRSSMNPDRNQFESNVTSNDSKLEHVLSKMPPEIREIAQRHPGMVSSFMNTLQPPEDIYDDKNTKESTTILNDTNCNEDSTFLDRIDEDLDEEWGSNNGETFNLIPHNIHSNESTALRRRGKR